MLIDTSPEPASNWTASITEDLMVIGGLWTALHHPWLFLVAPLVFLVLMVWLLPKLGDAFKRVLCYLGRLFGWCDPSTYAASGASTPGPAQPRQVTGNSRDEN